MKKIVTPNLIGGLGNQLFQISTALAYGKKYNLEPKFDLEKNETPLQGNPTSYYKNNLFKNLKQITNEDKKNQFIYYKEPNFSYSEIPFYDGNILLDGYFQSSKHFEILEKELLNYFNFPEESNKNVFEFIKQINTKKEITSIHVRRGDYLQYSHIHLNLKLDYYNKSISFFTDNVFVVFSDDINWCKENFKNENILFSPFENELDDLNFMINSNNNIIANSSFSWWGAYLNRNENKKVISPTEWFGSNGPKETQDLIPISWFKI